MTIEITDIQRCCTHDGPGIRTVVFFKGCPLRCKWCHNPETQRLTKEVYFRPNRCIGCMQCVSACPRGCHLEENGNHFFDPSLCMGCMACAQVCPSGALESASQTMELEEIVSQVLADRVFYRNRGGLTVSGGEPTLQKDGLLALLQAAKKEGIHTCLETCGFFPKSLVPELCKYTDLFLFDVKDTDRARHAENTQGDLGRILENLRAIDAQGGKTVLRCLLIPEVNLNEHHAKALITIYDSLKHCSHVELLAYHPYGLSKSEQLGRQDVQYRQPEIKEMENFASLLTAANVPVKLYGSML